MLRTMRQHRWPSLQDLRQCPTNVYRSTSFYIGEWCPEWRRYIYGRRVLIELTKTARKARGDLQRPWKIR